MSPTGVRRLSVLLLTVALGAPPASGAPERPGFRNAGPEAGLAGIASARTIWADIDGDRFPDLVLHGFAPDAPRNARVLLSRPAEGGGRRFVDVTEESGIWVGRSGEAERRTSFAVAGDVDSDGDLDLFSACYLDLEHPRDDGSLPEDPGCRSEVLLGDGRGHFAPAPPSALREFPATTAAACFLDADSDGRLDLYAGNWYRAYGQSYDAYPDRLFIGQRDGTFVDGTEAAGLLTGVDPTADDGCQPAYGVAHTDWNGDGAQDIVVCNYGRRRNFLWRNRGDGTFEDVGEATRLAGDAVRTDEVRHEPPFRTHGNTFDAACADFDADGDVDIFLSEITHWWAGPSADVSTLLVNQGPEAGFAFVRDLGRGITRAHEDPRVWNQGDIYAGWLDAENDGDLDLVLASSDYPDDQRLRLFCQEDPGRFVDRTREAGIDWRNPTAISLGDYDRDGDVDIVCGSNNVRLTPEQTAERPLELAIWRNEGARGHFLGLFLVGGEGSNRAAIGARALATAGGRTQMREVHGGCGHAGHQNDLALVFGLGECDRVETLTVRWPDRAHTTETFENVAVDRYYVVTQGRGIDVWEPAGR